MNTATFIRQVDGFRGDARLYRVQPEVQDAYGASTDYVIVSAVDTVLETAVLDALLSEAGVATCETYIFPANAEGEVLDWMQLHGSQRGTKDHEAALLAAGYTVEATP